MKPFLLLSIRAETVAAEDEYAAFCRFLGVAPPDLHRIELGREPLGSVDLDRWSGIVLGGGSFTYSDPEDQKSAPQRRAEGELVGLLDQVVGARLPVPWCLLRHRHPRLPPGRHRGRLLPRARGPLSVTLTDDGLADPLFADVPRDFAAYGGHKEALTTLPDHAVHLATSAACPVQAFRVGENVYATQFHPELDLVGVQTRIDVYSTHGYFEPNEAATLRDLSATVEVRHPMTLLRNFARRYGSVSKS